MAALTRKDVKAPVLRKEAVACPSLGGDVVMRMLTLSERLALHDRLRAPQSGAGGDAVPPAAVDAQKRYAQMAGLLALCAIDAETGEPLMSAQEWDLFAAEHTDDAMALLDVAKRLSGFDSEDVRKN